MSAHPQENVKFRMEITGQFRDALTRQANEGVRISTRSIQKLINSKSVFNHPPAFRIIVGKKKKINIFSYTEWNCSALVN